MGDVRLVGLHQVVEGGKIRQLTGFRPDLAARLGVHAVVHGQKQALGEVDVPRVGPGIGHPLDIGLHAVRAVVAGLLERGAADEVLRDDAVVVHDGRVAQAFPDGLADLLEHVGVDPVVVPEPDGRLRHPRHEGGVEDQAGQLVGGVLAAGSLAADRDVLEERETGEGPGRDRVHELDDGGALDPQAGQQFHGLLVGDAAFGLVLFVEGVEVLVQPAHQDGVGVGLDVEHGVDQPDGLEGFPEGLGREFRHPSQGRGDLEQLGLSGGFTRLGRLLLREVGVAVGESDDRFQGDLPGLPEGELLRAVDAPGGETGYLGVDLVRQAPEALRDELAVVDGDVALGRPLPAHGDHAVGDGLLGLAGDQAVHHRVEGGLLPLAEAVLQDALGLVGHADGVGRAVSEVVDVGQNPAGPELGADDRGPRLRGRMPDEQLALVDEQGHLLEDLLQRVGPLEHGRLGGVLLVGLRHQQGPLGKELRRPAEDHAVFHAVDPADCLLSLCCHFPVHFFCPPCLVTFIGYSRRMLSALSISSLTGGFASGRAYSLPRSSYRPTPIRW